MTEHNWDEPKIKFYKYYFKGVEKPIIMEAYSKEDADYMLSMLPEKSGVKIDMSALENFKIEMPLTGVSERVRFGQTYIWVGLNHSADGWMLKDEFLKITNNKNHD